MFTGIIEELGIVSAYEPRPTGARLIVRCKTVLSDAQPGCSIAVNGVCLTAVELTADTFAADLAPETLARTNLGLLSASSRVNLERPVTPATRLSGHIVQGHIDTTAELQAFRSLGDGNYWMDLKIPGAYGRYLVEKGSIAVDGISLTIASLATESADDGGPGSVIAGITIIPHTFLHTTLGGSAAGGRLNIEVDVLAKHVEKLLKSA